MTSFTAAIGRIFIAILFIVSGVGKMTDPQMADSMIVQAGLPQGLGLIAGVCEVVGGAMLALGLFRRLAATLLGVFTVIATLLFHKDFADPMQLAMALKNLAIVGGLMLVLSEQRVFRTTTTHTAPVVPDATAAATVAELDAARAERRADVAELQAERAEAAVEGVPPRRRRWWLFEY